jgi:opacity protein-like surface antigen
MRILATISSIALATGLTTAAHAQFGSPVYEETKGFYLGGGYTYLDVTADSEIESVDDIGENVNALTARVGYQFTPIFAFEADASFGIDEGDFDFQGDREDLIQDDGDGNLGNVVRAAGTGDLGIDYLVAGFARVNYPIADRLEIFGRLGYAFVEAEINARLDPSEGDTNGDPVEIASGSDDGIAFGGGVAYDFNEAWQLRADYTRYEFDGAEANAGTVMIEYKFGGARF